MRNKEASVNQSMFVLPSGVCLQLFSPRYVLCSMLCFLFFALFLLIRLVLCVITQRFFVSCLEDETLNGQWDRIFLCVMGCSVQTTQYGQNSSLPSFIFMCEVSNRFKNKH